MALQMRRLFVLEDDFHAEPIAEFSTWDDAVTELNRIAHVRWGDAPNRPPCQDWASCRRDYELVEYNVAEAPWTLIRRAPALKVSAEGVEWLGEFERRAI